MHVIQIDLPLNKFSYTFIHFGFVYLSNMRKIENNETNTST